MEEESGAWLELSGLPADPPAMRQLCAQCGRPRVACWCWALPRAPLIPRGRVVILQHPAEQRRALQTARALQLGLAPGRCLLYRGKRFPLPAHDSDPAQPPLRDLLTAAGARLLYPARGAEALGDADQAAGAEYTLVLLDGTWPQARAMLAASPALRALPAVRLPPGRPSRYVVRSQPAPGCLSTLEAAAAALSVLEREPLYRALLGPLLALCDHQLRCGAAPHDPPAASS